MEDTNSVFLDYQQFDDEQNAVPSEFDTLFRDLARAWADDYTASGNSDEQLLATSDDTTQTSMPGSNDYGHGSDLGSFLNDPIENAPGVVEDPVPGQVESSASASITPPSPSIERDTNSPEVLSESSASASTIPPSPSRERSTSSPDVLSDFLISDPLPSDPQPQDPYWNEHPGTFIENMQEFHAARRQNLPKNKPDPEHVDSMLKFFDDKFCGHSLERTAPEIEFSNAMLSSHGLFDDHVTSEQLKPGPITTEERCLLQNTLIANEMCLSSIVNPGRSDQMERLLPRDSTASAPAPPPQRPLPRTYNSGIEEMRPDETNYAINYDQIGRPPASPFSPFYAPPSMSNLPYRPTSAFMPPPTANLQYRPASAFMPPPNPNLPHRPTSAFMPPLPRPARQPPQSQLPMQDRRSEGPEAPPVRKPATRKRKTRAERELEEAERQAVRRRIG